MSRFVLPVSFLVAQVAGHAAMVNPAPRNAAEQTPYGQSNQCGSKDPYSSADREGEYCGLGCVGDACLWYQIGCFSGCSKCSMTGKTLYPVQSDFDKAECPQPQEPTLADKNLRSYNVDDESNHGDWTKYFPWRSPGSAGVGGLDFNPCGVSSGSNTDNIPPATGTRQGMKGTDLPILSSAAPVWKAGSQQNVEWSIYANHGGGYSYRLCKKDADGEITEGSCQKMPLDFVGNTTKINYYDGSRDPFTIPATTTSEGTFPANSQWRKNPIPMCNCDLGEGCGMSSKGGDMVKAYPTDHKREGQVLERCPTGVMFETPWDDGYGAGQYGESKKGTLGAFPFTMTDTVQIPAEAQGEYVLSWRWDCEQTPQVWNSCADVTIN